MPRNIQFQVLRGTQAQLSTLQGGSDPDTGASVLPLQMGEMYFATDTGNLFFGTPGFGIGYIQIGDTTQVNDTLKQILVTMEAMRRALVAIATDGKKNQEQDFDPQTIAAELARNQPPSF